MIDDKVLEAFHMMWDSFPAPVRLIHKNKQVLAINEMAKEAGLETGVSCFSISPPEAHKGCKANVALSTNKAQIMYSEQGKVKWWLPVKGYNDIYIHFSMTPLPAQLQQEKEL